VSTGDGAAGAAGLLAQRAATIAHNISPAIRRGNAKECCKLEGTRWPDSRAFRMIASCHMADRRLSFATACAFVCAALGLWVSLGAITLTSTNTQRARFGILPPAGWLAAFLGVALCIFLIARPQPRRVSALWLATFAVLPWLPARMPLSAFIWAGPARFWLWIAIAATPSSRARRLRSPSPRDDNAREAVACATHWLRWRSQRRVDCFPRLPAGDEPHYWLSRRASEDRSQIENNHHRAITTPTSPRI
jgi:hypothetical protein